MPGEEEWSKPLRGRSRNRWYFPSKYLHMDFSPRHYLAMQLRRLEAKTNHQSIKDLWDTVKLFQDRKDSIETFLKDVDVKTFRKSTVLQDAHDLLQVLGGKTPQPLKLGSNTRDGRDKASFGPFLQYALSVMEHRADCVVATEIRRKQQLRRVLAMDTNIVQTLATRNRFVDALYLRRRAYYLEKLSRKKPVGETIQKYRKHFTVHPDHKILWPDNKGVSQHSWPSK
ncbi:uncharacterized protein BXIN_1101 [Babesia sp. Xinjiang]|uniref:uncharacterized protein n=1 Tax=Babesia sp. Xinjiang TaxID=462227 RepID=UPI000A25350E|nr:uncharacterized protein BXIN_1101 [Babesia sp. Xinjiang]ORM42287.1 hypothetical protein BXIN_1101 [Babesia sp. Xinjiang]